MRSARIAVPRQRATAASAAASVPANVGVPVSTPATEPASAQIDTAAVPASTPTLVSTPASTPTSTPAPASGRSRAVGNRRPAPAAAPASNTDIQPLVPDHTNVDALIDEVFAGDVTNPESAARYAASDAADNSVAAARGRAAKSSSKKPTGRGPGRPRKQDTSSSIIVAGIATAPVDPLNMLELEHYAPSIFRKLVMALHAYEVAEVDMIFDGTGLHVRTTCSLQKNNIYFDVDGSCMKWYYCERPIAVSVKLSSLVSAVDRIGRYHDKIAFMMKRNTQSKLFVVTHETEMGGNTNARIDVVTRPLAELPACIDDETNYPISFMFSSAELKKLIANARKMADQLTIERDVGQPMQLTIQQNGILTHHQYPAEKIKLRVVGEDDLVSATVPTSYVKKFTDTIIGDTVSISVDSERNMCFASCTGKRDDRWAFTARVFIKLKK